jgi:hypothetical protein
MSAVHVVPGVHPFTGLLVIRQARVQPPLDAGPAQVHQLLPVHAQGSHRGKPLVRPHQDREMRVGEQDGFHAGQRGDGNQDSKEAGSYPARPARFRAAAADASCVMTSSMPGPYKQYTTVGPAAEGASVPSRMKELLLRATAGL